MPSATINGPKIDDVNTKRVFIKEVTDALEKAYRLPRRAYHVIIKENLPENVGVGGILIVDKSKRITDIYPDKKDKALNTIGAQVEHSNPVVGIIVFLFHGEKIAVFRQGDTVNLPETFARGDEYLEQAVHRVVGSYVDSHIVIDSYTLLSGKEYREDIYQFNYIAFARIGEPKPGLPHIEWISQSDLNRCIYPYHKTLLQKYFSGCLKDKAVPYNFENPPKPDKKRLGKTRKIHASRAKTFFPMPSLTVDGLLLKFSESLTFEGIVLEKRAETVEREPGKWAFPAGFIQAHETVSEALIREVREEIGIVLKERQILSIYKYGTGPYRDPRYYVWTQFLAAFTMEDRFTLDEKEIAEARIFPPDELPYSEMAFDHGYVLKGFMRTLPYYINRVKEKVTV